MLRTHAERYGAPLQGAMIRSAIYSVGDAHGYDGPAFQAVSSLVATAERSSGDYSRGAAKTVVSDYLKNHFFWRAEVWQKWLQSNEFDSLAPARSVTP